MSYRGALFIKVHDRAKSLKLQHVQSEILILLLKASRFGIKDSSKNHAFPRRLPGDLSFRFHFDFMRKWSILVPLQNPVGAQLGPKIDQVMPKAIIFQLYGSAFLRS